MKCRVWISYLIESVELVYVNPINKSFCYIYLISKLKPDKCLVTVKTTTQ